MHMRVDFHTLFQNKFLLSRIALNEDQAKSHVLACQLSWVKQSRLLSPFQKAKLRHLSSEFLIALLSSLSAMNDLQPNTSLPPKLQSAYMLSRVG